MTGLVTQVSGGLVEVDGFRLLTDDGEVEFMVDADSRFLFPEPHLRDHLRSGEPVSVEYRSDGAGLIVVTVDDA